MTTVLLVNPAAGHGRGARVSAAAIRAARRTWRGVESIRTGGPGDGVRLAAEVARAGVERLIVVGGDGSVHEAANGLLTSGVADPPPLGVVPVGTGNDFARSLGTRHSNPARAIATLARAEPARWDVGRAGSEYFVNSLGIGFDADVAVRVNTQRRLRGFAAYAVAVAHTLSRIRPLRVIARWEGGTFAGHACSSSWATAIPPAADSAWSRRPGRTTESSISAWCGDSDSAPPLPGFRWCFWHSTPASAT